MTNKQNVKGNCLCGAVKCTVKTFSTQVGACHCDTCRKWTGGPLLALDCGTDVEFEGENSITRYASSEWAERGFCQTCGTHLFYRLKHNNQHIMPAGLFDEDTGLNFDHQIFIESKPAFYDFANKTKNMTGEEVFAQASANPEQ